MKLIKNFKVFESINSKEEFIDKFFKQGFPNGLDPKVRFKASEIIYDDELDLSNKGLKEIPVKIKSVIKYIDVSNNNLSTFEFLPDEIYNRWNYGYYISGNNLQPPFSDILDQIFFPRNDNSFYWDIHYDFIRECLSLDAWSNNQQNNLAVLEAWKNVKLDSYNENKNALMYGYYTLLDLEDEEIFRNFFSIESDFWEEELIEKLIQNVKGEDTSNKRWSMKLLFTLIKKDDSQEIQEIIEDKYDISEIYKRKKEDIEKWSNIKLDSFIELMEGKLNRSKDKIQRDRENDLFAFIAKYEFVENSDGSYRKKLDIENLIKIDLYNESDLSQISMMKIRARVNDKKVYIIWIPKGFLEEDQYYQRDIPDYLIDLIDKKKTEI
jgi:hypothetical protein